MHLDGSESAALECNRGEQGRWEASVHARGRDGGPAVEEEVEQRLHAGTVHPHHRLGPVVDVNPTRALTGWQRVKKYVAGAMLTMLLCMCDVSC